jgi:hypothetical protein
LVSNAAKQGGFAVAWTIGDSRADSYTMPRSIRPLSPAFLSDAVGKLDAVFGDALGLNRGENVEECYRDVTAKKALTDGTDTSG